MASARELLLQADALMRRNRLRGAERADASAGIPVLTEIMPSTDIRAGGAHREDPGGEGRPEHDVTGVRALAELTARPPTADVMSANDFDDVPLLTDVVADPEPISILGVPEDVRERSPWSDRAARDAKYDRWDAAPGKQAPMPVDGGDSRPLVPAAEADASPRPLALPAGEHEADPDPDAIDVPAPFLILPQADDDLPPIPARSADRHPVLLEPWSPVPPESDAVDAPPAQDSPFTFREAVDAAPEASPWSSAGPERESVADKGEASPGSPAGLETESLVDAGSVGSIDAVRDAARWESLAEEIRMQVLQRIDIFTDTGLQEQLTARLQPIVDRASVDLVAAINQHLGQLLRAYVSEAIEREIDKWRRDGA